MEKKIYGRMGNLGDKLEEMLAEETELLRTITWGDLWPEAQNDISAKTILESVTPGKGTYGLVRNLRCEFQNDAEGFQQLLLGQSPRATITTMTSGIDYFSLQQLVTPGEASPLTLNPEQVTQLREYFTEQCDTDALARLDAEAAANPGGVPVITAEYLVGFGDDSDTGLDATLMWSFGNPNFPMVRNHWATGLTGQNSWASCRTLFRQNSDVFVQAGLILNIAVAAQRKQSAWMYWRLGPMVDLEKFFQAIINWIESAAKAIQAIIDTILEYINYIQQRIYEIQSLIRKINAIIQSIFLFEIPAGYVSFYMSDGTDGLLMDFMSSTNKPTDAPTAWGACALAVVPLIPYSDWLLGLLFPDVFGEETAETTGGEAAT